MKKLHAVFHYATHDTQFMYDYHSVELFLDDEVVLSLDDEYHDKPQYQIRGFTMALEHFKVPYEYSEERIADSIDDDDY